MSNCKCDCHFEVVCCPCGIFKDRARLKAEIEKAIYLYKEGASAYEALSKAIREYEEKKCQ